MSYDSRLKDFAPALKHIADIIERGIREHPELSVGMQTEGIEVKQLVLLLLLVPVAGCRLIPFTNHWKLLQSNQPMSPFQITQLVIIPNLSYFCIPAVFEMLQWPTFTVAPARMQRQ